MKSILNPYTSTTKPMTTIKSTYAVDDEFSNQITCGLPDYDTAVQVARRYLSEHSDAPAVCIYEDTKGGESWELRRDDDNG